MTGSNTTRKLKQSRNCAWPYSENGSPQGNEKPLLQCQICSAGTAAAFSRKKEAPKTMGLILCTHKNSLLNIKDINGKSCDCIVSGEVAMGHIDKFSYLLKETSEDGFKKAVRNSTVKKWVETLVPANKEKVPELLSIVTGS